MELEVKREQYKKEKKEVRWKQLQYQKETRIGKYASSSAPRSRSETIGFMIMRRTLALVLMYSDYGKDTRIGTLVF